MLLLDKSGIAIKVRKVYYKKQNKAHTYYVLLFVTVEKLRQLSEFPCHWMREPGLHTELTEQGHRKQFEKS